MINELDFIQHSFLKSIIFNYEINIDFYKIKNNGHNFTTVTQAFSLGSISFLHIYLSHNFDGVPSFYPVVYVMPNSSRCCIVIITIIFQGYIMVPSVAVP